MTQARVIKKMVDIGVTVKAEPITASGPVKRTVQYPHGASIKWPRLYRRLREKGYDKSKAAAISNSSYNKIVSGKNKRHTNHAPFPGKGGVYARGNKTALRQGRSDDRKHWGHTASAEFACHDASCAPPPAGTGGSKGGSGRVVKLRGVGAKAVMGTKVGDGGFTIDHKGRAMKSGISVALSKTETFIKAKDAFDTNGNPTPALARAWANHLRKLRDGGIPSVPGAKMAIGAWHNPADGLIEFNVSAVFPTRKQAQAVDFAKSHDQISVFKLDTFEVINTGGSGGERAA
jgi:hypothetical protein